MMYVVHIRSRYKKQWHFCKRFKYYDDAYDFITKPKTYLYNGRYNSSKSRYYRISACDTSIFCEPDYYIAFPCVLEDKTYEFNHIMEVTYEDILKLERL